jgi:hypothetical protein
MAAKDTKTFWIRKIRKPFGSERYENLQIRKGGDKKSPLSPSSSTYGLTALLVVQILRTELICTSSSITNYPSSSDRSICVRGASATSLPFHPTPSHHHHRPPYQRQWNRRLGYISTMHDDADKSTTTETNTANERRHYYSPT